jgi:hypothetical protein
VALSELRAHAWKYACLAVAVLAVAAVVAAALFHGRSLLSDARADAASRRADAAEAAVAALKLAIERDDHSAEATAEARASADQRATEREDRVARVEVIANERREAVPVGCPAPDARMSAELQDGGARVRAAEDRLRGYGRPESKEAR